MAQFFGLLAGVLVCMPIYAIIVRIPVFDPNAPSGQVASQDSKIGTSVDSVNGNNGKIQARDNSVNNLQTNLLSKEFSAPSVAV
ncbi:MAG: hypothetical protein ABSA77_05180 [Thermoguttaceae bacterium]|jgi:hypothetical protein